LDGRHYAIAAGTFRRVQLRIGTLEQALDAFTVLPLRQAKAGGGAQRLTVFQRSSHFLRKRLTHSLGCLNCTYQRCLGQHQYEFFAAVAGDPFRTGAWGLRQRLTHRSQRTVTRVVDSPSQLDTWTSDTSCTITK